MFKADDRFVVGTSFNPDFKTMYSCKRPGHPSNCDHGKETLEMLGEDYETDEEFMKACGVPEGKYHEYIDLINSIIKCQKRIGRPLKCYDDYISSYRSSDWSSDDHVQTDE